MATALDTARYLIHLASQSDDGEDDTLCNMRFQKLVYYAQAWHLAATGTPLFGDQIVALKHGPVVKSLYHQFKPYSSAIPPEQGGVPESLSSKDRDFIESIWERYKGFSGTGLRNLTRREAPWIDAWAKRDPEEQFSNVEITPQAMQEYFLPRFVDLLKREDARVDLAKWKASAEAVAAGRVRNLESFAVNFEFVVPDSVHNELASSDLSDWILDDFYEELEKGISQEQFDKMRRFAFGTTRVYYVDIPDPTIPGTSHFFTLWLTHGPDDNKLTINQCE